MILENRILKVGTRASTLARCQTDQVISSLKKEHPSLRIETIMIQTKGDQMLDGPLYQTVTKGYFTSELENALMRQEIDLAIHSLKDLPTDIRKEFKIGAVLPREDPRDVLVGKTWDEFTQGIERIKIGTSSLRRIAQLKHLFPKCNIVDLRGNIDTRIRKVRDGVVDCAILALAGIRRIGKESEISSIIDIEKMIPAPAQGAVGVEIRSGDPYVNDLLKSIHCAQTEACIVAERSFMHHFGSGCQIPVAAFAQLKENSQLILRGRVNSIHGEKVFESTESGPSDSAAEIGKRLAGKLIERGAGKMIELEMERIRNNG